MLCRNEHFAISCEILIETNKCVIVHFSRLTVSIPFVGLYISTSFLAFSFHLLLSFSIALHSSGLHFSLLFSSFFSLAAVPLFLGLGILLCDNHSAVSISTTLPLHLSLSGTLHFTKKKYIEIQIQYVNIYKLKYYILTCPFTMIWNHHLSYTYIVTYWDRQVTKCLALGKPCLSTAAQLVSVWTNLMVQFSWTCSRPLTSLPVLYLFSFETIPMKT